MICINFDAAFEKFLKQWMKDNASLYHGNMDLLEEMVPEVYDIFLRTPARFLGGRSPKEYFDSMMDAQALVEMIPAYIENRVPVPGLLLDRIVELGPPSEEALLRLLRDPGQSEEAHMLSVNLLTELESREPLGEYVSYIAEHPRDDRGELYAEALCSMGDVVVGPVLSALETSGENGRDLFADVLSNFAYIGDDRIFDLLQERFDHCRDQRALYASYLSRYGDDRALPLLVRAAQEPDVGYLDYVEIVNAIEALGGERPPEREFSGDPAYEALGRLREGNDVL